MYTDPNAHPRHRPRARGRDPVFVYHDTFNPDTAELDDLKERYQVGGVGDVEVKRKLAGRSQRIPGPHSREPPLL